MVKTQPVPGMSRTRRTPWLASTLRRRDDGQPEPDARSIHAALRKRQEQLFGATRRQAAALIRDLDHDAITG